MLPSGRGGVTLDEYAHTDLKQDFQQTTVDSSICSAQHIKNIIVKGEHVCLQRYHEGTRVVVRGHKCIVSGLQEGPSLHTFRFLCTTISAPLSWTDEITATGTQRPNRDEGLRWSSGRRTWTPKCCWPSTAGCSFCGLVRDCTEADREASDGIRVAGTLLVIIKIRMLNLIHYIPSLALWFWTLPPSTPKSNVGKCSNKCMLVQSMLAPKQHAIG